IGISIGYSSDAIKFVGNFNNEYTWICAFKSSLPGCRSLSPFICLYNHLFANTIFNVLFNFSQTIFFQQKDHPPEFFPYLLRVERVLKDTHNIYYNISCLLCQINTLLYYEENIMSTIFTIFLTFKIFHYTS